MRCTCRWPSCPGCGCRCRCCRSGSRGQRRCGRPTIWPSWRRRWSATTAALRPGCTCWRWRRSPAHASCWHSAGCRRRNERSAAPSPAATGIQCFDRASMHMSRFQLPFRIALPAWLQPQPGSLAALDQRAGRSPWLPLVHLVWSVWVFLTPAFAGGSFGYGATWAWLTLLSYPLFVLLYLLTVVQSPRRAYACALALVALCFALLPWYPSGLSYFVFGCVMLQPRRGGAMILYLAMLLALNALLIPYALHIGYPWQA